jgi:hypothetical protein
MTFLSLKNDRYKSSANPEPYQNVRRISNTDKNITKVGISSIRDGDGEGEPLPGVGQWIRRLQLGRHIADDCLIYAARGLTPLVELGGRGRVRGQMQLAEAAPAAPRYLQPPNFNFSKEIIFSLHELLEWLLNELV